MAVFCDLYINTSKIDLKDKGLRSFLLGNLVDLETSPISFRLLECPANAWDTVSLVGSSSGRRIGMN